MISLFYLGGDIFHSKTPPTAGVRREVRETININDATCICGK